MSSQENHANSGEVVTSIEAQSGAAAPERREPAEPVDVASQAQPEVETNQEPVADSKPESAPLPVEEPGTGTPEIAEPEAEAGTEAEAATSAEAAAPEVDSSTTEAIPEVDETEAANGTEGEAQASAETAAPEATSSTAEAAPEVAEPEAATSTEAGAQMSAERAAPEVISSTTEAAPEVAETEAAPSPEPAKVAEAPTHQAEESEDETLDPSEVQRLMESMEAGPSLAVGEVVQGQVLKVTEEEVFVDLGLKCEAVIPRSEFVSEDGQLTVQTGETIDVLVEKFDELTGTAVISRRKAVNEKLWEEVERAFYEEIPVKGQVVARVKGGVEVNVGVRAFMPGSQADLKPHPNLDELIGQEIICKVIKLNRKRDNVVVSRRKALEEGNQQKKAALLEVLAEGAVLTGVVKNLTDYGAFVDLGGMDGLLHLTDLSWARVTRPSEVVQVGQEIQVKVLKFDKEKERISLGLRQLSPDPWEHVASVYQAGERIQGKVVSVTDYGAFIELEPGIEGLIHISEMSWTRRLRHPSKILKPGEQVEVAILDVNTEQRRISLSLRHALPDPWEGLSERMGVGTVVQGRVRHFTDFGAFVEVEEGIDGLIHVSNLSWTKNVKHPSELLRKGQQIEAVVLNVDTENRRLSLGLKQLQPDAWENFFGKTNVGDLVHAKVTRRTSFGIFAEIEEGIEGLCHISEIENSRSGSEEGIPKVGEELDFRVIRLSPEEKKISLSTRLEDWKASQQRQKAPESSGLSRMAEAFSSAGITTPAMVRAGAPGDRNNSQ